jgi:nondiscriminating glutamyl-tRNA synthetase
MTIRTRFAPSPTGYLHIGGVRTALFNWLLTRRLGGQFILRIDDTDAERNRPEALQPILDGFRWLGITWDEGPEVGGPYGPYFQSQRNHLYVEAAMKLLESGHAYPDYVPKEELDAERKEQEKSKKPQVHRGLHRDTPAAECLRLYRDKPTTLRLKVPLGRTFGIDDLIRGRVQWQSDLITDFPILRADGRALYNFATVVDDIALKITHVIRASEHLSNTDKQVLIYDGLGLPPPQWPQFGHIPVVNEPAPKQGAKYPPGIKPPNPNKKLSKREMAKFLTPEVRGKLYGVGWADEEIDKRDDLNPATVAFYRELGYLPAGLVNYLGRLGWSLDDKTEIIGLEEMIAKFGLERVNKSPASFDPEKMLWVAGEYMQKLPLAARIDGVIPFLRKAGCLSDTVDAATHDRIGDVIKICGDRLKIFSDILMYGTFFFRDPDYNMDVVEKRLRKEGIPELVQAFAVELKGIEPFDANTLEERARAFCEARGAKLGDLNHALRVATTGVMVGAGMFDILSVLGRDEVLRRIETALRLPV